MLLFITDNYFHRYTHTLCSTWTDQASKWKAKIGLKSLPLSGDGFLEDRAGRGIGISGWKDKDFYSVLKIPLDFHLWNLLPDKSLLMICTGLWPAREQKLGGSQVNSHPTQHCATEDQGHRLAKRLVSWNTMSSRKTKNELHFFFFVLGKPSWTMGNPLLCVARNLDISLNL